MVRVWTRHRKNHLRNLSDKSSARRVTIADVQAPAKRTIALKIAHKGMGLIIIPFLFNCVWVLLLSGAVEKTSQLAELEHDQAVFIERLNPVMDYSYETRESFIAYLLTNKQIYWTRASEFMDKTRIALKNLSVLPRLTEGQKICTQELSEVLEGQFEQISRALKAADDPGAPSLVSDIEMSRSGVMSILTKDLGREDQIGKQRSSLEAARAEGEKNRQLVKVTVWLGMLGNLLLAAALILFFNKDMSQRLKLLVDNAQRLPRRQALNMLVSGDDELTYLDTAMHQAADDLQKAFDFRASLMQMVAHDLRSPLFSCRISLDIISDFDGDNLSPKGQKQLMAMNANLERLVNLINDLLFIEQFENDQLTLNLGPENMKEVIETSISAVAALADVKEITLVNSASKGYAEIDRERILQVLVNYLSNAIKFSPKGGTVEVSTAHVGNKLKVSVTDHGSGIRKEDAAKLFQKFFQAQDGKAAGGTGLGLAISKLIITSHGGEVGVNSEVGKGSTFWFSISASGSAA